MSVHLKVQIRNNFVRGTIQSKHMPAAIIGYSVAYDYYTYGTHVSRVRSVTYTGYDTDPADIPKEEMSSIQLQTPSICHICANTGQI